MGTTSIATGDSYVSDTNGTVTSVTSGDTNRITVATGTTTPVISAPDTPTYVGITLTSGTISSAPSGTTDIVNKAYADLIAAGFTFETTCLCASTTALTVTYANGTAGVGATLTNAGAQAAFSVDGISPTVTKRVLIKDQASTFQNGIYTVTTVGSGSTNWVLTRATDYDTPSEITTGGLTPVQSGTLNASSTWLETATVTTVGTDAITYTIFSQNPANVAITGGTINGTTIGQTTPALGTFTTINSTALSASQAVVTDGSKNLASLAYTNANTVSTLVQRDGSGNFSAGTITAALTGNASTATALQNARTIGGVSFDGTGNIVPQTIQSINEASDTTCFPLFITASGTQSLQPLNNTSLTFNASTANLGCTTFTGALVGNASTASSAAILTTTRAIYGNNFDGSAALTQIIASTYGGTGNGFTKFSGATTSEKTYTLPNSSATILTDAAVVTAAQGGTGVANNAASTITISGNFGTTFTVTATTNATIPSGTHTLSALDVAQTWTAIQTFTNSDIKLLGSSTGATTFTSANAGASNYTLTFPAVTDTIAVLGTAQTFTKTQSTSPVAVTSSGASIATDASLSNVFTHTMTENTTLANPTNLVSGTYYQWTFTQASSAKTLAYGNKFKWPGGTAMTISTGNAAIDTITSYYDGTNLLSVFSQAFA